MQTLRSREPIYLTNVPQEGVSSPSAAGHKQAWIRRLLGVINAASPPLNRIVRMPMNELIHTPHGSFVTYAQARVQENDRFGFVDHRTGAVIRYSSAADLASRLP